MLTELTLVQLVLNFPTDIELGTTSTSTIMVTTQTTTNRARSEQNIELADVMHEWAQNVSVYTNTICFEVE